MREVQRGHAPAVTWHPLEIVNHVHMFPQQYTGNTLQTVSFIHILSSHTSTQITFVSHWQIVFRYLANSPVHTGTEFLTVGPFSILAQGLCDTSGLSCNSWHKAWTLSGINSPKISFFVFTDLINTQSRENELKLIVTFNTVVWVFIHTGYKTPPCNFAFPSFLGFRTVGAPGLPSRVLLWQLTLHYVTVCTDCLICSFITVELEPALPETCFQTLFGWLGMHDAAIVELSEEGVPLQMYSGLF